MARPSRRVGHRRQGFRYPVGVELVEGENYRQYEGHEAEYLTEDEHPRYQYTVVVSTERLRELFLALAATLPEKVSVVLELPGAEEDACDIWMSPPLPKRKFARIFRRYQRFLCNDGMIGYGAMNPDAHVELFLDEHKILYYYSPDMDPPDEVLSRCRVPYVRGLRHYTELAHVHYSLSAKGGEDYVSVAERLMEELDLEYQESRKYT